MLQSVDLFGPPAQLGLAALKGDELRGRPCFRVRVHFNVMIGFQECHSRMLQTTHPLDTSSSTYLTSSSCRGVSTKIFQVPMQDHTRKAYTRLSLTTFQTGVAWVGWRIPGTSDLRCFAEEGSFKQKKESFTAQVELNHTSGTNDLGGQAAPSGCLYKLKPTCVQVSWAATTKLGMCSTPSRLRAHHATQRKLHGWSVRCQRRHCALGHEG